MSTRYSYCQNNNANSADNCDTLKNTPPVNSRGANGNDGYRIDNSDIAVLYTSTHPYHHSSSRITTIMSGAPVNSGVLGAEFLGGEDQCSALLKSHVGIPVEITDSVQSWVDVQESINEAMRESPIPGDRRSLASSGAGIPGASSFSGAATPSSLARLTFLHPSSEHLLQAGDSPTPSNSSHPLRSPSLLLLQSPMYIDSPDLIDSPRLIDSPDLMSIHSQSPPPEADYDDDEDSAGSEASAIRKNVKNSEILERICFDRVNAAAACLNSQVESGMIESEKVISSDLPRGKSKDAAAGSATSAALASDSVWDWSSRPEVTPPKDASYARTKNVKNRHRKTNPTSNFYTTVLLRLEVFSAENFPVLFVSHACSVLLGAALMLLYVKRR